MMMLHSYLAGTDESRFMLCDLEYLIVYLMSYLTELVTSVDCSFPVLPPITVNSDYLS